MEFATAVTQLITPETFASDTGIAPRGHLTIGCLLASAARICRRICDLCVGHRVYSAAAGALGVGTVFVLQLWNRGIPSTCRDRRFLFPHLLFNILLDLPYATG